MREPRGSVLLALLAGAAGVTLHQNAHQGLFESADSPHLFINGSGFDVGVLGDLEFKPTLKRDFDYEIVSHGATWIKLRRLPPRTWWSGHYSTEPSWTQPAELLLMSIELGGVNYGATGGVTIATIFSDPHVVYGATPVHAHPNANVPAQEYFDSLPQDAQQQITQEVNEQYEDAQSVDAPVLEKDIFEDVVDEYELHNPSPFAKLSVRCSGLDAGAVALDLDPVPSGDYTVTVASDGTALEIALTSPGAAWCAPERCPDSPAETVPLIVRGVSTSQRGAITFLHPVVVATVRARASVSALCARAARGERVPDWFRNARAASRGPLSRLSRADLSRRRDPPAPLADGAADPVTDADPDGAADIYADGHVRGPLRASSAHHSCT